MENFLLVSVFFLFLLFFRPQCNYYFVLWSRSLGFCIILWYIQANHCSEFMPAERAMQFTVLTLQGFAHKLSLTHPACFIILYWGLFYLEFRGTGENQMEVKCQCHGDFGGTGKLGKKKIVVIMLHSSSLTRTVFLKTARTKISGQKTVVCLLWSRTSAAALSFPTKF